MRSINYQLAAFRRLQVVCHFPQGLQSALILHAHEEIIPPNPPPARKMIHRGEKRENKGLKTMPSLYPGCKRIFMGDFRFWSSFHSDLCEKLCFVASPLVPGANSETSHRMWEKNLLYPGKDIWLFSLPSFYVAFLADGNFHVHRNITLALLSLAAYTFSSTLIVPILHQ